MYKVIAKLIGNTERTIFAWKKENRSIINFLEKYFSEEDLEEYLRTGKIDRLEQDDRNIHKIDDINVILIDYTKYQLKDKLQKITDKNTMEWLWYFFAKKILIKVLHNISSDNRTTAIMNSKEFLLNEINDLKIDTIYKAKRSVIMNMIEQNLSDLECYVLIKHYKEILDYGKFGLKPNFDS
ncbi:hypothetical protein ACN09X_03760 [Aliarcobacter butzleri]|uniref:hypothetical protein n=1 Tax=Aliarcobacter butzleri TaxID=28197 RepID=UPI001EDB2713|nr:hypothetical protein [Aliarcobacter butzleri]MCG3672402.1 hypothetical protein [Aliarcobacter butzleri]MCT7561980.1 hypothetical protein [Aliarcobacter butzleri]MDN5079937.1 hypothetical protein [Aliarcobacter butzleri]